MISRPDTHAWGTPNLAPPPAIGLPWVAKGLWCNILFLSWPLPPEVLRPFVPRALELRTHEEQAWITVGAMDVRDFHYRGLPVLAPRFFETNLRTYVSVNGQPGVWFLSIDADARSYTWIAEHVYRAPAFPATFEVSEGSGARHFASRGSRANAGAAELAVTYGPPTRRLSLDPGTLEHFLLENSIFMVPTFARYVLQGATSRGKWDVLSVPARVEHNTLGTPFGLPPLTGECHACFTPGAETIIGVAIPRRSAAGK